MSPHLVRGSGFISKVTLFSVFQHHQCSYIKLMWKKSFLKLASNDPSGIIINQYKSRDEAKQQRHTVNALNKEIQIAMADKDVQSSNQRH